MEQWKSTLQQRHAIAAYRDATDLAVQVAADLSRSISGLDEATRARDNARAGSTVSILDELTSLISKAKKSGVTEAALLSSLRRSLSSLIADTQRSSATVFFSYSQQDREIVQKIAAGLSQAGVDVWLGGAEFQAGMSWVEALERALEADRKLN